MCFGYSLAVCYRSTGAENREVTQEEIEEYAEFLGIDLDTERHLLWIARQGVAEPPPAPWK
ncbi:unnamed protein product, partial [Prorocentrum cordatum]